MTSDKIIEEERIIIGKILDKETKGISLITYQLADMRYQNETIINQNNNLMELLNKISNNLEIIASKFLNE